MLDDHLDVLRSASDGQITPEERVGKRHFSPMLTYMASLEDVVHSSVRVPERLEMRKHLGEGFRGDTTRKSQGVQCSSYATDLRNIPIVLFL